MSEQKPMIRDLSVTRLFDAPVERVWAAWTDPRRVMRWWGPEDYTSPSARVDLREGGTYVFAMQAPEEQGGQVSYVAGTYSRIVPNKLLEFTQILADEHGNPIDPTALGMPADFPAEIRTSVEFRPKRDNLTELRVTEHDWPVGQMYVYSIAGLNQSLEKLAKSLEEW